jgi:hypothetical protein
MEIKDEQDEKTTAWKTGIGIVDYVYIRGAWFVD